MGETAEPEAQAETPEVIFHDGAYHARINPEGPLGRALAEAATLRLQVCKLTAERDAARAEADAARMLLAHAGNQGTGYAFFDGKLSHETIREVALARGIFRLDDLHHAPACPANHYHRMRLPTAPCQCGAERDSGED